VHKTVLLADDSTTIQRVVELSFADGDVRVVSVGDGEKAVEAIRLSPPDLVLADIGMPGRSGYEVVEFVRSQPGLVSLPVLLLAGAFDPVDEEKARRVGADGVLTKPFDTDVLVERVHELLGTGRGTPSVIAPTRATSPSLRTWGNGAQALRKPGSDPAPGEAPAFTPPATEGDGRVPSDTPAESLHPSSSVPSQTDRYFDELDQAFAALSKAPRPLTPMPTPDEGSAENEQAETRAPRSVAPTHRMPLTDAFAALLEAERTGTEVSLPMPAPVAAPAIDVNALADQIARRVLEQLSDRVVRDTVADIVSATAERLVREEIERIKRDIT
jgi:CheY-like chemotaxis protein